MQPLAVVDPSVETVQLRSPLQAVPLFTGAVLRLLQKALSPEDFMHWLMVPGVSELERLPGEIFYSL